MPEAHWLCIPLPMPCGDWSADKIKMTMLFTWHLSSINDSLILSHP